MKYVVEISRARFTWNVVVCVVGETGVEKTPVLTAQGVEPHNFPLEETRMFNILHAVMHTISGEPLPHNEEAVKESGQNLMSSIVEIEEIDYDDVVSVEWIDLGMSAEIKKSELKVEIKGYEPSDF